MMQDLAMSNQHIAGVFGANLMPQQKPYDIKGMMGNGEVYDKDGKKDVRGMFQFFGDENGAGGGYKNLVDTFRGELNQFGGQHVLTGSFSSISSSNFQDARGFDSSNFSNPNKDNYISSEKYEMGRTNDLQQINVISSALHGAGEVVADAATGLVNNLVQGETVERIQGEEKMWDSGYGGQKARTHTYQNEEIEK